MGSEFPFPPHRKPRTRKKGSRNMVSDIFSEQYYVRNLTCLVKQTYVSHLNFFIYIVFFFSLEPGRGWNTQYSLNIPIQKDCTMFYQCNFIFSVSVNRICAFETNENEFSATGFWTFLGLYLYNAAYPIVAIATQILETIECSDSFWTVSFHRMPGGVKAYLRSQITPSVIRKRKLMYNHIYHFRSVMLRHLLDDRPGELTVWAKRLQEGIDPDRRSRGCWIQMVSRFRVRDGDRWIRDR